MTRFTIIYNEQAIADLEAIREFLDQSSTDYSDSVISKLVATIRSLDRLPTRNRIRFIRKSPRLSVYAEPVLSYLIYYRVDESARVVRVSTVRHTSRRPPKRFP